MSDIQKLTEAVIAYRDARDWKQFHKPKDVALSMALEVAEVMEHFQWKSEEEIQEYVHTHKEAIADELIDVLYWILLMSHDLNIDIVSAFEKKMKKNVEIKGEVYKIYKVIGRIVLYCGDVCHERNVC
jgi:NTP pyrophosphatase (non-canonical NTP hydrolase)